MPPDTTLLPQTVGKIKVSLYTTRTENFCPQNLNPNLGLNLLGNTFLWEQHHTKTCIPHNICKRFVKNCNLIFRGWGYFLWVEGVIFFFFPRKIFLSEKKAKAKQNTSFNSKSPSFIPCVASLLKEFTFEGVHFQRQFNLFVWQNRATDKRTQTLCLTWGRIWTQQPQVLDTEILPQGS